PREELRHAATTSSTDTVIVIDRLQSRRLATSVESDVFLARVHPGWHYVLIVVAVVIGLSLVPVVQPDDLGFLGLLSALPLPVVLAMQALVVGFVIALRHAPTERILGSYTVALVTLLRGIPALAYEFPRLPWAWKHVGIVDYIQRHLSDGATVTDIEMRAYHNWPGFFGFHTVVTDA